MQTLNYEKLLSFVNSNLKWFENSGVMDPANGTWGVGERIVLTANNTALDKISSQFPMYSEFDGYLVLEQRRADCNFELAWLYYLATQICDAPHCRETCKNILHYLFHRSGMQFVEKTTPDQTQNPSDHGLWRWSNPFLANSFWLDDNAWICTLALMLSQDDELAQMFPLRQAGLLIADVLTTDCDEILKLENNETHAYWVGSAKSPHWGALGAMATAFAFSFTNNDKYLNAAFKYLDCLEQHSSNFTASEQAYMALGTTLTAGCVQSNDLIKRAQKWNDLLVETQSPQGNWPSQWGETIAGKEFVDLVYTQNWATLSLQAMMELSENVKYNQALSKSLDLLCAIQDKSPAKHLAGCWRGLYDLKNNCWGGGDKYEGGSNSIYTGWTNAPISWALAMQLQGKSLLSFKS